VIKTSGEKRVFDRDKIARSMAIALRKRPVTEETVEIAINRIVQRLESEGESEITSQHIGELVMETLKALDAVAYLRYASVYKDFTEAKDFEQLAGELG
jgi:transcriptional repressor NrdR